jgi:hypothetical protein
MDYDAFKSLSEDEQRAAYIPQATLDDITAERDSFKSENDQLREQIRQLQESERKTKEVNYTLSRQLDIGSKKQDPEELLHEMFK